MGVKGMRYHSARYGARFLFGASAAVIVLLAAGGCAKPVDEAEAAYKGPAPAKTGAPGVNPGGAAPVKPAAPSSTGPQRRPQ